MAASRPSRRIESISLAVMMLALFGMLVIGLLAYTDAQHAGDVHDMPSHSHEGDHMENETSDLVQKLKDAEIISDVIDEFTPLLTLDVAWHSARAGLGNSEDPEDMQDRPEITFLDSAPDAWRKRLRSLGARHEGEHEDDHKHAVPQLTLAMTDPDAPSRIDPEWSEFCHWIVTDVTLTERSLSTERELRRMTDIVEYKPPGPPPSTGKHRYVFVALAPTNGTTEKLHLSAPGDRQRWGYDEQRMGLRAWAKEMGLSPVGANFLYAQNAEQSNSSSERSMLES